MTDNYILYSNRKTDKHIFLRKESNGKETVITSDEVNLYNENYGTTMDVHHGLIRFMFETVANGEGPFTEHDGDKMDEVLRVPFDKFKDLK